MFMKNCWIGDLLGVIMCAKFKNEIFIGYDFTRVEFSNWFLNGTYNSAALLRCLYDK